MIILDCIHRSYSITSHLITKIIPKSILLYLYLYNFSSLIFDFFLLPTPSLLFLNNMESSYVSSPTYPFIPFYQFFVKYQYTVLVCIISFRLCVSSIILKIFNHRPRYANSLRSLLRVHSTLFPDVSVRSTLFWQPRNLAWRMVKIGYFYSRRQHRDAIKYFSFPWTKSSFKILLFLSLRFEFIVIQKVREMRKII